MVLLRKLAHQTYTTDNNILAGVKSSQFFYKFFLTSILYYGNIIIVKQTRKQTGGKNMSYYEQFNIFTGVCKRYVSVNIFPELEQTNVFVYDSKGNMLYNVFIVGRDIRNKQKLPAYLNKIIDNIKILFL